MRVIDITAELGEINFSPGSELEEIAQNVRTVLTTYKKTVPMDREFGLNTSIVDLPIAAAQAAMTADIVAAINRYEPRAQVVSVSYEGKEAEGIVIPKVRIKINGAEKFTRYNLRRCGCRPRRS